MRAMLLAAGFGTRLRPLTDNLPKCMVPVAGKPVLQRNIEWLRANGVVDLVINLHCHPESVTDYFADGSAFDVNIEYSYEPEPLGTSGGVWAARRFFRQERFWVTYADNLFTCDLSKILEQHLAKSATLTMALYARDEVRASGIVGLDEQARITRFKEKPAPHEIFSHWVNAGLLLCEPRILSFIPPGVNSDFGHEVLPLILSSGEPLYGYTMGPEEELFWIDTPEDLARTEELLNKEG
jgi:NDP-sugar pyrophosphorylase family protein